VTVASKKDSMTESNITPENAGGGSSPASGSASDEQFKLAKAAIHHVLNAIADDPRKYWLMGNGTGSWEKLTTAAAAIWNKPVEKIRSDFQPRKAEYERYCAELEASEKLLRHCRENGIMAE
jgi:hypothetical protein